VAGERMLLADSIRIRASAWASAESEQMDGHLIAIEVGVEGVTDERMDAESLALDRTGSNAWLVVMKREVVCPGRGAPPGWLFSEDEQSRHRMLSCYMNPPLPSHLPQPPSRDASSRARVRYSSRRRIA